MVELVRRKHQAAGTDEARTVTAACSAGLKKEFAKYVEKEKIRLKKERRASKGLWSRTRRLLKQSGRTCSVPALKKQSGEWCKDPKSKADHLAETFKTKYTLNEAETNHYSEIEVPGYRRQHAVQEVTEDIAEKVLSDLREDSATGPDELPARVLKEGISQAVLHSS